MFVGMCDTLLCQLSSARLCWLSGFSLTQTRRIKTFDTWTRKSPKQKTANQKNVGWKEAETHIRDDDGKLWVECVVHFADGSLVTPEGVVVLTVLGVWVADCGEHLVPGCGVGVRLRHAVRRLPANPNKDSYLCHRTAHVMLQSLVTLIWLCVFTHLFLYYLISAMLLFRTEHHI